jgi:hypothetical protein
MLGHRAMSVLVQDSRVGAFMLAVAGAVGAWAILRLRSQARNARSVRRVRPASPAH